MSKEMLNKKIVRTRSAPRLVLAVGMVLVGVGLVAFGLGGVLEKKVYIRTPKMLIRAEVSDDQTERTLGLSGRDNLSGGRAMLFVFDEPGTHGIWMKGMKFPIDIVWLDKNKRVVTIVPNVQAASYPKVFEPSEPSLYVIEFASGRSSELGIKTNQILHW